MKVLKEEEKEDLLKILKGTERIEKEVALSWDGSNILLRLPKEIADYLKINEKNRGKKKIKFIIEEKDGKITKEFEINEKGKTK